MAGSGPGWPFGSKSGRQSLASCLAITSNSLRRNGLLHFFLSVQTTSCPFPPSRRQLVTLVVLRCGRLLGEEIAEAFSQK